MQTYNYRARDARSGKIIKSTIQAQSEGGAAKLLMAQKIVPLSIEPINSGGMLAKMTNKVSSKELVIFTRQLSTMLNAGLPLAQSLATVQEQTASRALKNIIGDIEANVNSGQSMSASIKKFPDVFNKVYIAMVEAGETSGTLDQSLERLANQLEYNADMLGKIKGAMMYPAIVLAVIIGVVIFMLVSLVPQVKSLYDDMGKTLPLQTLILQAVADFIMHQWYIVILIVAGLIVFVSWWKKTEGGRRAIDTFKLNIPLFATLMRKLYMARFSRTMQTLTESGVSMLESLRISGEAVNNVIVQEEITQAIGKVKNGKPLSEALTGQEYILEFVPQMIKIGETSGGIDQMLKKVADYYDKEVDNAINTISTLIEPILMVVMAGMIGFIVIAVLLPIYMLSIELQ